MSKFGLSGPFAVTTNTMGDVWIIRTDHNPVLLVAKCGGPGAAVAVTALATADHYNQQWRNAREREDRERSN
jgi:hypothetical protein